MLQVTPRSPDDRSARGFTLIELLVVIAIIALLIGILLPTIGRAREAARATICLSNIRQFAVAFTAYADDFKERIPVSGVWARQPDPTDPTRFIPGVMYDYLQGADRVGECPTNKRRAITSGNGQNQFGGWTDLDFDYTMAAKASGARLSLTIEVARFKDGVGPNFRRLTPAIGDQVLTSMRGLPIFVEESLYWYNDPIRDGQWGNMDQITLRHELGGHIAYLDGSVEHFKPPRGQAENLEEPQDLQTNDIYVRRLPGATWVAFDLMVSRPYGWINDPKD